MAMAATFLLTKLNAARSALSYPEGTYKFLSETRQRNLSGSTNPVIAIGKNPGSMNINAE